MFALVDANAFYCSAEQVFRPDLRGQPIVVLSNNDGCIVAANRQAQALGIKKFQPFFTMKALCEQRGIHVFSSNYELYADLSAKMMDVIGRFAPEQYVYSIDESFLSFRRCENLITDFHAHATQLRRAVWKECRLPVCVGLAPTLTLAKAANHAAKKLPGYQGVCLIDHRELREKILSQLSVSDLWGIGRRLSVHLRHMGIDNGLDLAQASMAKMRKIFGVEMERTIRELNGQPCKGWQGGTVTKKQIFSTRSAGERITDPLSLSQALCKHAGIASRKAREQNSLCQTMLVFASSSPYDDKPVSVKALHHFAYPTADVTTITRAADHLSQQLFREGVRFYKFGVGLVELVDGQNEQPDLFNPTPNNPRLMSVFDGLNQRYGRDTIFLGAQGIANHWEMRRAYLTPQYTTNWQHLPKIRC